MKISLARTNKQNKLCLSNKTMERFLERIAKDDAKQSVANFRQYVPMLTDGYENYIGMKEWLHVYPCAEFGKDSSDNLQFKKTNGLVLLIFTGIQAAEDIDAAKKMVSQLPMTFAAIEGADGRSLIVLVSISDAQGRIPDNEEAAELLYQNAYQQAKAFYQPAVGGTILAQEPSLRANFLLTLDPTPFIIVRLCPCASKTSRCCTESPRQWKTSTPTTTMSICTEWQPPRPEPRWS